MDARANLLRKRIAALTSELETAKAELVALEAPRSIKTLETAKAASGACIPCGLELEAVPAEIRGYECFCCDADFVELITAAEEEYARRMAAADQQITMNPVAASISPISITGMAHIILNVLDWERAHPFYQALLGELCGLTCVCDTMNGHGTYDGDHPFLYFVGGKTAVGFHKVRPENRTHPFSQRNVGFHHLCLRSRRPEDIDVAHDFVKTRLVPMGAKIIRAPQPGNTEDHWARGYYSLLFEDPDGLRLEINHIPGKGLLKDVAPALGSQKDKAAAL